MPAISFARQSFSTFHGNTTAIPAEITSHIIKYTIADTHPLPMGGGVGIRRAHHAVTSVPRAVRMIYLGHPYPSAAKHRITTPIHLNIGEALSFNDLQTLAAFFREGPGRCYPLASFQYTLLQLLPDGYLAMELCPGRLLHASQKICC